MTTDTLRLGPSAFDELAASYDTSFTATAFGRRLRSVVWEHAKAHFSESGRLLEIGCGTGEDAVHLARCGHRVLATDISGPMLERAREKAQIARCDQQIEFRCAAMERLVTELGTERFDGTFSNFGVINCASSLDRLITDTATLLKPGGRLLWVLMGRYVPWEWMWFLTRLDRRNAFRRIRRDGVLWRGIQLHYPTPREIARALSQHFVAVRFSPLGVLLPPTYASGWIEHRPRLLAAFSFAESAAHRCERLAAISDHYIVEAQRAGQR